MRNLILAIFILCIGQISSAQTVVIADHTCTDVSQIPDEYINKVKTMFLNYMGESHARGVLYGFDLLAAQDSRYAVDVNFSGQTPASNGTLRVSRTYWDGNSWDELCGEQHFWTNQAGKDMLKAYLDYMQNEQSDKVSAMGFGWCWDMTWHNRAGGNPDPALGVRWAGSSEGGPDGDMRWGIDPEDSDETGNSVCLLNYLEAVDEYNAHNSNTITFFTTGPVDKYDKEDGYQRYLKHEAIRKYVKDNGGYLFDYADILNWEGNQQYTTTWNSITYPIGDPDLATGGTGYDAGHGGCHISEAACLKLAKAMWWLLARMAGWDGGAQATNSETINGETLTSFNIYPNPNNGIFELIIKEADRLEIINTQGQLILERKNISDRVSIDISNRKKGTYILRLSNNDKPVAQKKILVH